MMLTELAEKYRCDKCPKYRHHYTEFYESLLEGCKVRKMLELGIGFPDDMPHVDGYQTAASLKMWAEFFNYKASIYALDVNETAVNYANELPCVTAYHVNEDRIDNWFHTLRVLPRDLDFIVDDGSHDKISQFGAAMMMMHLLKPGGIYVIEDVSEPAQLAMSLPFGMQIETFGEPDDRLIVIRK